MGVPLASLQSSGTSLADDDYWQTMERRQTPSVTCNLECNYSAGWAQWVITTFFPQTHTAQSTTLLLCSERHQGQEFYSGAENSLALLNQTGPGQPRSPCVRHFYHTLPSAVLDACGNVLSTIVFTYGRRLFASLNV